MSTENCKLCNIPSTPLFYSENHDGHLCVDCYFEYCFFEDVKKEYPDKHYE